MTAETEPGDHIEGQVSMAIAALGVTFARTLFEIDRDGRLLGALRRHADDARAHLDSLGTRQAHLMFTTFATALHDKNFLPAASVPPATMG
jgi:hypothetical protein